MKVCIGFERFLASLVGLTSAPRYGLSPKYFLIRHDFQANKKRSFKLLNFSRALSKHMYQIGIRWGLNITYQELKGWVNTRP